MTSPTVSIVNRLLSTTEVDFPKLVILDMFLSFGVVDLLVTALVLGLSVAAIQCQVISLRNFRWSYLLAVYALPMLLGFEKEFLGLLFAFAKWLPALGLFYLLGPRIIRFKSDVHVANQITKGLPDSGEAGDARPSS